MKFLLSCTSSQWDLKGLIKYYRLEVKLAYLVDLAQFLLRFVPRLTFLYSKLVLHSLESLFTSLRLHLFWSCTSSWQDLKRLRKYNRLGGTACIFKSTLPNFFNDLLQILLCCTPNQSYTPLNHFFQEHVHIYLFLCGLVPLVGGILKGARKYYRLEVQLAYLGDFAQFSSRFALHFTFLHSKL